MGVRDHQLDPAQAAPGQLAQELGPERLDLGRADVEPQHLAPAVRIAADRHDHRYRDRAPITLVRWEPWVRWFWRTFA